MSGSQLIMELENVFQQGADELPVGYDIVTTTSYSHKPHDSLVLEWHHIYEIKQESSEPDWFRLYLSPDRKRVISTHAAESWIVRECCDHEVGKLDDTQTVIASLLPTEDYGLATKLADGLREAGLLSEDSHD